MTKVLVVGGGPAGSVTATLLAREGIDVELVERERFPRYHIGESLTPASRQVLELAGVADVLDEAGFQVKRGGVFRWGSDAWTIDWSQQFGDDVRTWQVDRAEFDEVLLDHARSNGVKVSEAVAAGAVTFDVDGRAVAVECLPDSGSPFVLDDFDFLIDASGRAGLLSVKHFRNRQPHKVFRNVAIWGYWRGGRVLPGPEGAVDVIAAPGGWYWVIPLAGNRTSVGLVLHKDAFARQRRRHADIEEMYQALIAESPTVHDLVAGTEYLAPARTETDYSYVADRFSGPGYFLVGDAACFLDPLLATGVFLALHGGLLAASSIASIARREVPEREAVGFFEYAYRRAYARLLALVSTMYERYDGKDEFFWTAQRLVVDVGDRPAVATPTSFGEIIAGLADLREVSDAETRVLTRRLVAEAQQAQRDATGQTWGERRPDTGILHALPTDDAFAGLRLVTSPRLGLQRSPVLEGG